VLPELEPDELELLAPELEPEELEAPELELEEEAPELEPLELEPPPLLSLLLQALRPSNSAKVTGAKRYPCFIEIIPCNVLLRNVKKSCAPGSIVKKYCTKML
jgi:hypothetical protein